MMADARLELFDVLVVWKLTRLGRNNRDILNTTEELNRHNINFHSISEKFDISTSTGRLMLQLLGSFGEFERNQISENVQMSMQSLVRDKRRFAGGKMLGYRSVVDEDGKKVLMIEPDEAIIVRFIYDHYVRGEGYRTIANSLNKQGFKTVKGKNPSPILVKGTHEPIIDPIIYEEVQKRLVLEDKQPQWTNQGENLLTGLLRCPECGGAMAASNTTNRLKDGTKKKIRYYSCATFRNKGASVCHANSIRADKAEKFIADRLKELVTIPDILTPLVQALNQEMTLQVLPLGREKDTLKLEQQSIQEKLNRWQSLLRDSPELQEDLEFRMIDLQQSSIEKQKRLQEVTNILANKNNIIQTRDVKKIVASIDNMVENQEKKVIKQIYRCFIEKITFNPRTKSDIQLTLKFDEEIINQLNTLYKEAVSSNVDTALFAYKASFRLNI